jgi:DNA end-binding protein Ku
MAPRAYWKGFLRLSLVTCPIALFPATSESEKISFNQINRKTGHRIKYQKVDADTGEEVSSDDIIKGYKVDTDRYLEVSKEELENISLESTRTIEIEEFVPKKEIDDLYLVRPYYIVPDGKVGHDAYAVIRETIRSMDQVALGRVVLVVDAAHRIKAQSFLIDGEAVICREDGISDFDALRRRRSDHDVTLVAFDVIVARISATSR